MPGKRIQQQRAYLSLKRSSPRPQFNREYKARGAEITREPEVTFYEMKEFELMDSNGYLICFGQDTSLEPDEID
jgi:hypothetical protein